MALTFNNAEVKAITYGGKEVNKLYTAALLYGRKFKSLQLRRWRLTATRSKLRMPRMRKDIKSTQTASGKAE